MGQALVGHNIYSESGVPFVLVNLTAVIVNSRWEFIELISGCMCVHVSACMSTLWVSA